MHGSLTSGDLMEMAADNPQKGEKAEDGSIHLCINFSSHDGQQQAFDGLSEGGNITMPLTDTFWGSRFGMIRDKYGVNWMLNFESGQKS